MRDLIISIFGTYTPVTDAAGTPLQGMAGVDWPSRRSGPFWSGAV